MKPVAAVTLIGLLGAAVGTGASLIVTSTGFESSPRFVQLDTDVARLVQLVESEAARRTEWLERMDDLERRVAGLPSGARTAISLGDIDAAVERALDARLAADEVLVALDDTEAASVRSTGAGDFFAQLVGPDLGNGDREALWQQIRDAGLTDDVVALFEQLSADSPHDADLRVALGVAYLEKTQELGQSTQAGVFAGKADAAFDAALAIDETNWDARFTKAVALSFWPPIFGKQREAVKHFETLVQQQQGIPGQADEYAQTYVLLGNLYSQMGQADKAMDTWISGYELYPDDSSLQDQITSSN